MAVSYHASGAGRSGVLHAYVHLAATKKKASTLVGGGSGTIRDLYVIIYNYAIMC